MAPLTLLLVCCCSVMMIRGDLNLDDSDRNQILDLHNEVRSKQGATKMYKLVWDTDLETIAKDTVKDCIFEHSGYHAENIAAIYGFSKKSGVSMYGKKAIINRLVKDGKHSWYKEIENVVSFDSFKCKDKKTCGHYTQMVKDVAQKVGCAAKYCATIVFPMFGNMEMHHGWFLSCEYDKGNMRGVPAFKKGTGCSACNEGDECENDTLCLAS